MTVFGSVVVQLMAPRGLRRWSELRERLARGGAEFVYTSITNWVYGRHAVNREFPLALDRILGLTQEERTRLALAFLFGQHVYAGSKEADESEVLRQVA